MKTIRFAAGLIAIYVMILGASFLANLAYNGNMNVATWNEQGRQAMVVLPIFLTFGLGMVELMREYL